MARPVGALTLTAKLSALLCAMVLFVLVALLAVYLVSAPSVVSLLTRLTQPNYILPEEGGMLEWSIATAKMTADFVRSGNQETEMIELYRQDESAGLESIGHLLDVRDVFSGAWWVAGISAVMVAAAAVIAYSRRTFTWIRYTMRSAAVLCVGIPLVLGLVVGVAFGPLFTFFHRVFFPQGNWQFPTDSYLIRTFPEPFWISATALILVLMMLAGLLLYVGARRLPAPTEAC